ncbi:MAG: endolytic transglycosylase MltG [Acidobacteriota bacterium]
MRRSFLLLFLSAVVVGLLGWAIAMTRWPFKGYTAGEQFVVIQPGSSALAIGRDLEHQGVIRNARIFWSYLRWKGQAGRLRAGEYRFDAPTTLAQVAARIVAGDVYRRKVTIPEGFALDEIADLLAREVLPDRTAWTEAMARAQMVADLDSRAQNLEGYLFPATYYYTRQTTPAQLIDAMVSNFRKRFSEADRSRAAELGMTVREAITLASLIEKETGQDSERELVSAVYHNRLKKRMLLQCDPTVIYAVKRVKAYDNVINQSDLQLDSPYNTYKVAGLPPGPIANPGIKSIHAALYPAATDYLYFVSRNDGTHVFSKELGQHHEAVQQHQR